MRHAGDVDDWHAPDPERNVDIDKLMKFRAKAEADTLKKVTMLDILQKGGGIWQNQT